MNFASKLLIAFAERRHNKKLVIGRGDDNGKYLTRWVIAGKDYDSKWLGGRAMFVHQFHRSDRDEMHNHPWGFTSLIVGGGYWEKTPDYENGWKNGDGPTKLTWYGPGRILSRPANWIHSVILPPGGEAVTIIFRGVKKQTWGFFCPLIGYVRWTEHDRRLKAFGSGCADVS